MKQNIKKKRFKNKKKLLYFYYIYLIQKRLKIISPYISKSNKLTKT